MGEYEASTYGDRIADIYDRLSQVPRDTSEAVALLAELARGGRALELGIGTGRLALPLRERGVRVEGIDASPAMVAKLREKPGGLDVPIASGNFADLPVEGVFTLIFVAFNTFFALLTQEDQLRCFVGVAEHLEPQGAFVIEAFAPDLTRFDDGQRVEATDVEMDSVRIDASLHDPVKQQVVAQHVVFSQSGIHLPGKASPLLALRTRPDGPAGRATAGKPLGRLAEGAIYRQRKAYFRIPVGPLRWSRPPLT